VGLQKYSEAGGWIERDLFQPEHEGYLTDSALLDKLVAEKPEALAEGIKSECRAVLKSRLWPFAALNSWTGSLSTRFNSWTELHLSRGLPWGACLRFKHGVTPEIHGEISPRIKCSSLRFKCNSSLHLNRGLPGSAEAALIPFAARLNVSLPGIDRQVSLRIRSGSQIRSAYRSARARLRRSQRETLHV
jgi:hypothetical protein